MPSKKPEYLKNQFFDINKLPPEKGLLLFPLSISKLCGRQNAQNCLEDIRNFSPSKVSKPLIGLNFIYGDFLYLYSNKPAPELKETFMHQVIQHKNAMQKLIEKNHADFQIQHAFNYLVWNQLYVGTNDFNEKFNKVKKIYKDDKKFQEYIKKDCEFYGRPMEENQINFFLEEFLMFYLLAKGEVNLPNEYIQNDQKWILSCYPDKPLRGLVYMFQLNPFKLDNPKNPYQNCPLYDLKGRKLYNADDIDLATYDPR